MSKKRPPPKSLPDRTGAAAAIELRGAGAGAAIEIRGARQNNLRNLDLDVPLNALTVVTGVSGSGKTSLAFKTLYAEGQRRYVETFSPYARQFLQRMARPEVDRVDGLPPALAIRQGGSIRSSRSTVGTMTDLAELLRTFYASTARLFCRDCGRSVERETPATVASSLLATRSGQAVLVTFPIMAPAGMDEEVRQNLEALGYRRIVHDGRAVKLADLPGPLQRRILVVQDRVELGEKGAGRLGEALEQAFSHGRGRLVIVDEQGRESPHSQRLHCAFCDLEYEPLSSRLLSPGNALGACPKCRGFGRTIEIDLDLVIPDPGLTLQEGAIRPWRTESYEDWFRDLGRFCAREGIPMDVPWKDLPEGTRHRLYQGDGKKYDGIKGFFEWQESRTYKMHIRVLLARYRAYKRCTECGGTRLRPEALLWRVNGKNIAEAGALPIDELLAFLDVAESGLRETDGAARLALAEVRSRAAMLDSVGVGYLSLDREAKTLSGGEAQRVHLTAAVGSRLCGALYVLDEPSIGLHPRDVDRLVGVLRRLRDNGNTVVVVEHDPQIIAAADHLIDLGPGPGERGGHIVYAGPADGIDPRTSVTARWIQAGLHAPQIEAGIDLPLSAAAQGAGVGLRETDVQGAAGLQPADWLSGRSGAAELLETDILPGTGVRQRALTKGQRAGATAAKTEASPDARLQPPAWLTGDPAEPTETGIRPKASRSPRASLKAQRTTPELRREPVVAANCVSDASGRERRERNADGNVLRIRGARQHNLRNLDVEIPLGQLVAVSGVSGSGKSTLVEDVLYKNALRHFGEPASEPGECDGIDGLEHLAGVELIDQSPVVKSPRSIPATTTKAFDGIRNLFSSQERASKLRLTPAHFSFNSKRGRCPTCEGSGYLREEMQFLPDVFLPCPDCEGRRFTSKVLEVTWGGLNLAEVLDLTVNEAVEFFAGQKTIVSRLAPLREVGLGYLKLGQPVSELSGGEAQRLKLASVLGERRGVGKRLLLLDEPTTGLHAADTAVLMAALNRLVEAGHSVLCVEHNLQVLAGCDWILELGPESGRFGGELVFAGRPEGLAQRADSPTGVALRRVEEGGWAALLPADDGEAGWVFGLPEAPSPPALSRAREREPAEVEHGQPEPPSSPALLLHAGEGSGSQGDSKLTLQGTPLPLAGEGPGDRSGCGRPAARRALQVKHGLFHHPRRAVPRWIRIEGAREHNLRNVDVSLPLEKMVVVTGVSGSGKSTLAFDVLFAEGQRRYLDTVSTFARIFLEQMSRPEVDRVIALPPTVAIEQRTSMGGLRSTVGTQTEIEPFLRLLYTKVGVQTCDRCHIPVGEASVGRLAERVGKEFRGRSVKVLAPLVLARKGFHLPEVEAAGRRGRTELRVDGTWMPLASFARLDRFREHTVEAVVASVDLGGSKRGRALPVRPGPVPSARLRSEAQTNEGRPSSDRAEAVGPGPLQGALEAALEEGNGFAVVVDENGQEARYHRERTCLNCGQSVPPPDPRAFSFNSHHGWCPHCRGTGMEPEEEKPAKRRGRWWWRKKKKDDAKDEGHDWKASRHDGVPCTVCAGARLKPLSLAVVLAGRNLGDLGRAAIDELPAALEAIEADLDSGRARLARDLLAEVRSRVRFVQQVGLGYLSLNRAAGSLSGGEAQRARLAAQLGAYLRGVCYVLDEPTIGLHPRDNERLLGILEALRDRGNTVVVVEHDEETIRRADHILDLGPAAGEHGGEIVAQGTIQDILNEKRSVTGQMLQRDLAAERRAPRSVNDALWLELRGARLHNLRGVDLRLPMGRLSVVTGVSGSGKSSLIRGVLLPAVAARLGQAGAQAAGARWTGLEVGGPLERVLEVDQAPIGRTPRSIPATYVGIFDPLRKFFAQLPEARIRGFGVSRFSFNTDEGRCRECGGLGLKRVQMSFLPDALVPCERCEGRRFSPETLAVRYQDKASIADILEMTVSEAHELLKAHPKISRALRLLEETGLGYLRLGQPSPTLSGGEAQRLKLVAELARPGDSPTLYVLEEPTIGLHMADVERLLDVLHRLVDRGHTVVVIEHNLELIAQSDHVVDLGPEGGNEGGRIIAVGSPEELVRRTDISHTARALQPLFR